MNKFSIIFFTYFLFAILLIPESANAYIGPGMAVGAIIAVIGVFIALLAGIFGLVFFLIKRFFENRKNKTDNSNSKKKNNCKYIYIHFF